MAIKKIKVSELPLVQSIAGLVTIGVDALNRSVKVSLEFLKLAADNANEAADNANDAAAVANTAASTANTAAGNVNAAASAATAAAGTANSAADNANDAASAATAAAGNANTAADAATAAADTANDAASAATAAAGNANTAADTATAAADTANGAASAATAAADSANDAASVATAAAGSVNTAADTATAAAGNASEAASAANTAADTATAAAGTATAAAGSATAAAGSANTAADTATAAASSADTAAATADAAATSAATAAGSANTAAANANSAADSANTASANANSAADSANTAAANADSAADSARGPVEFVEAEALSNIVSGEATGTIFGKLKKWFSSFGGLAWKSKVDYSEDITNLPTIPAAQIQSDYGQTDVTAVDFINNKPSFKTVFQQAITGSGDINPKLIKDIQYNGSNGDITIKFNDASEDKVINIPVDNFLSEAEYDPVTHVLTLTMANKEEVEINLGDLIDEYGVAEGGGLEIVNGNEFKIKDLLLSEITKVPLQKSIELSVAKWMKDNTWDGDGDLWAYDVADADVADGCLFEAWPADRKSRQVALNAEIDDNIIVNDGAFRLTCAKKPHSDFSIVYSVLN
jgi:hypothetical protein